MVEIITLTVGLMTLVVASVTLWLAIVDFKRRHYPVFEVKLVRSSSSENLKDTIIVINNGGPTRLQEILLRIFGPGGSVCEPIWDGNKLLQTSEIFSTDYFFQEPEKLRGVNWFVVELRHSGRTSKYRIWP
jgi:hypothetical protein